MNDAYIRQIVQDELRKSGNGTRFGLNSIPYHTHDGVNSQQINQNNIAPSTSVAGAVSYSNTGTYTLNLNASFTPSLILAHGNVIGNTGQRYYTFGIASLIPSFFFQTLTNTSVQTGAVQYPSIYDTSLKIGPVPLQSSTYFGAESAGGAMHTLASDGHIVRVFYSSTVFASANITQFSKNKILINVDTLASGWSINLNCFIS